MTGTCLLSKVTLMRPIRKRGTFRLGSISRYSAHAYLCTFVWESVQRVLGVLFIYSSACGRWPAERAGGHGKTSTPPHVSSSLSPPLCVVTYTLCVASTLLKIDLVATVRKNPCSCTVTSGGQVILEHKDAACKGQPIHHKLLLTVIYRFQTLKLTIGPKLVLVGNLTTSLVPINLITTSFENEYKRRSAAFWGRVQDTPTGRCVHPVGGQGGRSKWCVRCKKHGGVKECHFLLTSWRHHDSEGKMVQRVSKCVGRVHKTVPSLSGFSGDSSPVTRTWLGAHFKTSSVFKLCCVVSLLDLGCVYLLLLSDQQFMRPNMHGEVVNTPRCNYRENFSICENRRCSTVRI